MVGVTHPVLQDGMGGGALGTGRLAAAVTNAGGLGSLSTPGLTGDLADLERAMRTQFEQALNLTDGPLAVNCPVGTTAGGEERPAAKLMIDVILDIKKSDPVAGEQVKVFTSSAGLPSKELVARIHDAGLISQQKIGHPRHAEKAVENGVDVIIASGFEMGGHTLKTPITTTVLVPEVLRRVDVPVLASGGFKDGIGLAGALGMGAAGIAMGTRFLASLENDWHDNYIERILAADIAESIVMPGVYGPCRYLDGKAVGELTELLSNGTMSEEELTNWKAEHAFMAQRDGDVANGLTAAGMVGGFIGERLPVAAIVGEIVSEARKRVQAVAGLLAVS
ncbi:nitronate monooxygenase [Nocardia sp. NPDC004604]|uniref:NAD(P)H-dependent flavin oxidoreductase n=1 Tax=Nocardia sp. NPDC004604 TaxID=3157013 RepID=UPI0033BBB2BE